MKRVYLDTNVLVTGILREKSNSRILLELVKDKHFENQNIVPTMTPRQFLTELGVMTLDGDL